MGPNVYGRGEEFLRNKELLEPAEKTTNREHRIMLLRANDLNDANTFPQKEDKNNITYQKKDNIEGGPPWDTERYCELDHCLVREQWSNSIIDMQSYPHTNINTDHKMTAIKVRRKLKAREEPNREPTLKGRKPEKEGQSKEEALDNYNVKFRELVIEAWGNEEVIKYDLYILTKEAAHQSFDEPKTRDRRENCDPRLRALLSYRRLAIESNDSHTTKQLTRQIKQFARQIKLNKLRTSRTQR